ncbi:MAG: hypothetical protein JWM96_1231 [Alphaproteobacteria bacterium]|nr:hypothetical protein [Alphaproteobacteria bacterium]
MADLNSITAERNTTVKTAGAPTPVAGDVALSVYLPSDLIGGSIPYIAGSEDEAVWNAASQACATDRIHYVYTVADNRIWYLATPSASLASNPDSWCPLAAALPGNSEFWDRETVYLFDQEGTAAGLRWDGETGRMQVFVGPSRTVLPRLQTLDANFATINPERAKPVPWKNQALMQEKLSRATVRGLFMSGMAVAVLSLILWMATHLIGIVIRPNLAKAEQDTQMATEKLMVEATRAVRNDADHHLYRLQELLLNLQNINGTLLKYEVTNNAILWEALVPQAAGGNNLRQLRAQVMGSAPDGRVRIQGKS